MTAPDHFADTFNKTLASRERPHMTTLYRFRTPRQGILDVGSTGQPPDHSLDDHLRSGPNGKSFALLHVHCGYWSFTWQSRVEDG